MNATQMLQMAVRLEKEAERLRKAAGPAKKFTGKVKVSAAPKTQLHGNFGHLKKKLKTLKPGTKAYRETKAKLDKLEKSAGGGRGLKG